MIKLTEQELEQYVRDLFKTATASFVDMEDTVVEAFMKKVVEKHTAALSIPGHSLNSGRFPVKVPQGNGAFGVKLPQQQQQRELFSEAQLLQANEAEQRL